MTDAPKRMNETAQLLRLMVSVFNMDKRHSDLISQAADELESSTDIADELAKALKVAEPWLGVAPKVVHQGVRAALTKYRNKE